MNFAAEVNTTNYMCRSGLLKFSALIGLWREIVLVLAWLERPGAPLSGVFLDVSGADINQLSYTHSRTLILALLVQVL